MAATDPAASPSHTMARAFTRRAYAVRRSPAHRPPYPGPPVRAGARRALLGHRRARGPRLGAGRPGPASQLTTTRRRSGRQRTRPLIYHDDYLMVVSRGARTSLRTACATSRPIPRAAVE